MENRSAVAPYVRQTRQEYQQALGNVRAHQRRHQQELDNFAAWAVRYRQQHQDYPPEKVEQRIQDTYSKVQSRHAAITRWATHLGQLSPNQYRTGLETGAFQETIADYQDALWDLY